MKHLYWIGAVAIIALGLYFTLTFSVGPETTPKIAFTQVSTPEDMGKEILSKLHQEIKDAPIAVLGVTPNKIEDMELWKGFIEANQEVGMKYDVIIVEPMLPYVELFREGVYIAMKDEMSRLVEGVNKARSEGLRVALIVPHIYASQLLESNPVAKLKSDYKLDVTSFTVSTFPVTRDQEQSFEPKCIDSGEVDPAGTAKFGCAIRNAARRTYRKKLEPNKYSSLAEQVGPKDFIILFNRN
ncbi:hypothetical protein B9G69_016440 [Bdellovibrio sp. SKB1291214]|uniref:hypothetical protein n=1 Tax=Bdellovibrio sp. SKB1291214 TaxID=1732569 RepID=UPI000B51B32D|nr:hypothetical protein [Bdellovibrio sp. SKB1291214]UYL08633.1 hypothetical protein B9G69_016440 [Bdellovibrio sp. SKB1291214]